MAIGATTFTLSSLWTLPTYQMRVTFSSGEQRFVQFTTGSTSVGSFTALTLPQTSTQIVVDTAALPMGLVFNNCYVDGVLMGLVGAAGTQMYNCRWGRYSDFQDGTNGTVTFSAPLASGATSATLSSSVYPNGWPYQSGQYAFTLSQGQLVYCTMTYNQPTVGTFGTQIFFTSQPYANATGCSLSAAWQFGTGTYNITLSDGSTNTLVVTKPSGVYVLALGSNYTGTTGAYMASITGGNGMTGNGAILHLWLTGSSTSVTQVSFAGATGSYTMNFWTGVSRAVTLTKAASASQGNLAITFTSLGGSSTTQIASNATINLGIINGATAAVASGNIGGVQHFSAPPHALYMNYDNTAQGYPYQLIMKGCTDESTFVGLPTRRETSSGFTNSIKFCPDTRGVGGKIIAQTTVDGFTSSRAEGGAVLLPQGFGAAINGINTTVGGGRLINSTFSYDSSIVTLDGGVTIPALSLTGGLPTCNVTIDNNVLIDRAAVPAEYPPFTGSSVATSNNVVISNNTQYMNNWDNGYFPYIQFEGNNIQCVGNRFHLNTHSDTQTSRGVFFTQSPSINTQSKFEAVVAGWRLIPIVFNHTIPGQSTLSTLTLAANWPYANATGLLTFLDNETRWVSFSTGSNVVTVLTSLFNQTALTNTSGISVSMTNGSANISGNNSFVVNDQMMFSTTVGTSGGQVVPSTVYYVVAATYNTFQVSATMGGTAITFNASSNPTSPPTAQFMPATGHTFQGMCIGYNRIAYQMRCGFSPGTNGTRATLEDLTNNIVYTFDNNMITAVQTLYMTFTPPSGATSFTMAPTIESGDSVIAATLYMNTGAAVSTGNISLGYVGTTGAFIQNMTGTGTIGASAEMIPGSTLNITSSVAMAVATTGTFTGNGSLVACIRCACSLTGT